jgi:large subunit ribosomal protein L22
MPGYTFQKWRDADGSPKSKWKGKLGDPDALSEEGRAKYARALALDRDISRKAAREIAATIRGWPLQDAIEYLEAVRRKEVHVPYRIHTKQITHKPGKVMKGLVTGEVHRIPSSPGRYPENAAKEFLRALRYAQAYAEERELNTDFLRLVHVAGNLGPTHTSWMPRAHGRATEKKRHRINIEVVVREDAELERASQDRESQQEE